MESSMAEAQKYEEEDDDTIVEIEAGDETAGPKSVLDDDDSENEVERYSGKVQKRINNLTQKRRQAIEEAQAAYQYAQQVAAENEAIKRKLAQLDQGYVTEYETRVTSQENQAKRALQEAHEAGDYQKVADAQSALAQIAIEKERVRLQKARSEQERSQAEAYAQQQVQRQQQPQQQPAADPRLQKWLTKNTWFNQDRVMTSAAKAIHEDVVMEGFDPNSDEYYSEIDRRLRKEMPNKFQDQRKPAGYVAPATNGRTTVRAKKQQIELTPGQVAFANKMKIPLEKYAQEVAKIQNRKD
jgi:hypothetical protein